MLGRLAAVGLPKDCVARLFCAGPREGGDFRRFMTGRARPIRWQRRRYVVPPKRKKKEQWYKRIVPNGMLPAVQIDGKTITESDEILFALEDSFGPLGAPLGQIWVGDVEAMNVPFEKVFVSGPCLEDVGRRLGGTREVLGHFFMYSL